ncbi:MAG: DUF2927 domain-containing protein [Bacteroidota bacterium]
MKKPFWLISFFSTFLLVISCNEDDGETTPESELNTAQLEAISYFKEVALGFENGNSSEITRKWNAPMNVFVGGNPSEANTLTLEQAVTDINQLATDGFSIEIVNDSLLANCYIFFGSGLEFTKIFPEEENNVNANTIGFFSVWWNSDIINEARIVINPELLNPTQQRSVILEEITQSTGLTNDSPLQPNSIFYETANNPGYAPEYADIDRELIRLLYHPKMTVGLDETQVDAVLRDILSNE